MRSRARRCGAGKPAYLAELRADAVAHGAKCLVPGAEQDLGHTFAPPAILYPVTKEMRVWHEEQFGPVVPVGSFSDVSEVSYGLDSLCMDVHDLLFRLRLSVQLSIPGSFPWNLAVVVMTTTNRSGA